MNQELKNIDENKKKIKKSKKGLYNYKYLEHFLILVQTTTGCISISASSSLLVIAIGVTSLQQD